MTRTRKYPPHLYTLELTLSDPRLPALFHHYPTEPEAKTAFQCASILMNRSANTITRLALFHKHSLILSAQPTPPKPPAELPLPDASGVRHLPPRSRALTFNGIPHGPSASSLGI